MSFWEELGQKLTQSGQEAMQKTREIAGVVTMNADIYDSKRKIRDLYAELGELVVNEAFEGMSAEAIKQVLGDEHADDKNVEIVLRNWKAIYSKAMFIRSEQEVIAMNEAKINELKAETKCPACGSRISKGISFCPNCGAKIVPQQEAPAANEAADQAAASANQAAAPENTGAAPPLPGPSQRGGGREEGRAEKKNGPGNGRR